MILALDCSASRATVALVSQGHVVVKEIQAEAPRGRGGALFTALEEIMGDVKDLERIVIGIGPGSYNGIRSALAAGWGIAAVRGVPVVGVSSLLGLSTGSYVAVGDARRGQYYWAVVELGTFLEEPVLLEAAELPAALARFPALPRYVPTPIASIPEGEVTLPSAVLLAAVGVAAVPGAELPEPLYLKPAYINLPGFSVPA